MKRASDVSPCTEKSARVARTEKVAILDAGAQYGKVRAIATGRALVGLALTLTASLLGR